MNTPIPINFSVQNLGSGDAIVVTPQGNLAQGGKVDWGDANPVEYLNVFLGSPLHTTKIYPNAIGSTTIHAMAWAQFKYQNGGESGSYESCVDATASLTIGQ
ncbi:MAG TPA: hypothetical protein VJN93_06370 [Candidatus Acidoferrum sp.]|nr:hypothetical protein [Candidatus Acidoferrum sp.]